MKFESITMENFMRYKGRNHIEFSCDDVKNVTVVLGDNTVGKTTIAQAFRWGLYGALMTNGTKSAGDFQLLNTDILEMMDANSRAKVKVEIAAVDEENVISSQERQPIPKHFQSQRAGSSKRNVRCGLQS